MAIKALNGFGWYVAGLVVAPGCYLVSSMVAAERTHVEQVERAIAKAKKDIRELETEFDTRANLAQLERWNGEVMRYTAPTPQQFLASDAALASLVRARGRVSALVAAVQTEQWSTVQSPSGNPAGDSAPCLHSRREAEQFPRRVLGESGSGGRLRPLRQVRAVGLLQSCEHPPRHFVRLG